MAYEETEKRAKAIAAHGGLVAAVKAGAVPRHADVRVSEAIVLGLHHQGVRNYVGIFGHGTTDIGNMLRIYERHGLVKTWNVRHETEAAHAVTALKIRTGETAAVITSIGPGAMHAFAGSLTAASNGVAVYHIYGDETTRDEGFNMQQVPKNEQGLFLKLFGVMGDAYAVYDPYAVFAALRRGAVHTGTRGFRGPFYLLAPMNVQPAIIPRCNLLAFPERVPSRSVAVAEEAVFAEATALALRAEKVTIKIGGGGRGAGKEVASLARLLDAAIVSGAGCAGTIPFSEPRYMTVGGSKGSISGNYAMHEADLAIIVGARQVCQWDSSGTAWKHAKHVINFNLDAEHVRHYNHTLPVEGDAKANLQKWIEYLKASGRTEADGTSAWARATAAKRAQWDAFRRARYEVEGLPDAVWGRTVLTQPAAIKAACDFAKEAGAVKYFDAGDVQANGFQIVEDEEEGYTCTDTGASYMGYAASALLAGALADDGRYSMAFCGDGSFTMNPQILLDGVEHGVWGCVLVFDNRRMAAISGLQQAQYGQDYKTHDRVEVDYVRWAESVRGVKAVFGGYTKAELDRALDEAFRFRGLSLIHIPVYYGPDPLGNMGVFGKWNVGNWCEDVQEEKHRIGL